MKTLNLIQGSPEWFAHRATHWNASDAPAMLGCSPYKTRTELLKELKSGIKPEVDAGTQRLFDDGHRFEALARPLAEKIIGESLYPVTGAEGKYSASFDGLTMAEDIAFEHKSLNAELRALMIDDCLGSELPLQYRVQMEQQCMVSGAKRILFMASKWNGDTPEEKRHCWYTPDLELRQQIIAGWEQFEQDLAAYVPPEVIVPAVAAPQMGLPAVSITVNGSIALVDNLDKFGTALTAYVERINKKPETDQDFADLEATVRTLKNAEDALDAAESGALAQTDSIDAMRKTVELYRQTARTNRLLVEKLVKAEKENRRNAIVGDAVADLVNHVKSLNARLGKSFMPMIANDFAGVIKGLKSLDSMKDKVAGELARCKIEANAVADRIQANMKKLIDAGDRCSFPDAATLVLKASEDLDAVIAQRIAEADRKLEEQRNRIRAEEQAKAEKDAREKLAAEAAQRAQAEAIIASESGNEDAAFAAQEIARQKIETAGEVKRIVTAPDVAPVPSHPTPALPQSVVSIMPAEVQRVFQSEQPTLKLGQIGERLGFGVTADFLRGLGFEPAAQVKNASLFHESDFPLICNALIAHIEEVSEKHEAVAAC